MAIAAVFEIASLSVITSMPVRTIILMLTQVYLPIENVRSTYHVNKR